jgi:hypothetical protein
VPFIRLLCNSFADPACGHGMRTLCARPQTPQYLVLVAECQEPLLPGLSELRAAASAEPESCQWLGVDPGRRAWTPNDYFEAIFRRARRARMAGSNWAKFRLRDREAAGGGSRATPPSTKHWCSDSDGQKPSSRHRATSRDLRHQLSRVPLSRSLLASDRV